MLKWPMHESENIKSGEPGFSVPSSIVVVIDEFNGRLAPYEVMDVHSALCAARAELRAPSSAENKGAWSEILAFGLTPYEHNEKPWGTYFGPIGSRTENGETVYFPDVHQADEDILSHWRTRATTVSAPLLSARYNDLVWDLGKLIANAKRDVNFARRAIDAYLIMALRDGRDLYHAFPDAERALALAIQIGDAERRESARKALLSLHGQAVATNDMWWQAYDAFEQQPKSGLTDAERASLIADLEAILSRVSDASSAGMFDPHAVESVANKLIAHYRRVGKNEELKRLHLVVAKAFEHFGSLANPMLASIVFQTSMDAYRQAGMKADEKRVLRLIEKSNLDSIQQMSFHEVKQEVPQEDVEKFVSQIVGSSKEDTFDRIAKEFLTLRSNIEETLKEAAKTAPLSTIFSRTKLNGDRVVAHIGPLNEDLMGRLIEQSHTYIQLSTPWLWWALEGAKQQHSLCVDDIVVWANRAGLFGDGVLLTEGLSAWFTQDYVKAIHVLVPQIEAGFRKLIGCRGQSTTKPHPTMRQARTVLTFGDMLFDQETAASLGDYGSDLVFHFRSLYADPRGHNLRNDLAHGLATAGSLNAGLTLWVIHSVILLGAWLKRVDQASE